MRDRKEDMHNRSGTSVLVPKTVSGILELLPPDQHAFQTLLDTIRQVYELYGFVAIETPVFETLDVLFGDVTDHQIYLVQSMGAYKQEHVPDMGLRFDLTVPLARYVAQHEHELVFPFRRYQIQRVYRGERAQQGRFREFYQCDIDILGKDHLTSRYDAELPLIINDIFNRLGLDRFIIMLNNRRLLCGLIEGFGFPNQEQQKPILRTIDKLLKHGIEYVATKLKTIIDDSLHDTLPRLFEILTMCGTPSSMLEYVKKFGFTNQDFCKGYEELVEVVQIMRDSDFPADRFCLNFSIARGLDYYTGTVYETFLTDYLHLGSVCSGGRYDNLARSYTSSHLPGVGLSIGATRLFSVLLKAGHVTSKRTSITVLVTQMQETLAAEYSQLATRLRAANINTLLYRDGGKLAKQLRYADRVGIPWVVIMGEDEKRRDTVMVKSLQSGIQKELLLRNFVDDLKTLIAESNK